MSDIVDPKTFLESFDLKNQELSNLSHRFRKIFVPLAELYKKYESCGKRKYTISAGQKYPIGVTITSYYDEPIDIQETGIRCYVGDPDILKKIFHKAQILVDKEIKKFKNSISDEYKENLIFIEKLRKWNSE